MMSVQTPASALAEASFAVTRRIGLDYDSFVTNIEVDGTYQGTKS